jgi:anti-anti-sigma factor
MEVVKTEDEGVITLAISGKLSAATAEEFGVAVDKAITESTKLILDFQKVSYLASAGIRILISTQKKLIGGGGSLTFTNVQENISEVFELTGLDDVFNIQ